MLPGTSIFPPPPESLLRAKLFVSKVLSDADNSIAPATCSFLEGLETPIPTLSVEASTNKVLLSMFTSPSEYDKVSTSLCQW